MLEEVERKMSSNFFELLVFLYYILASLSTLTSQSSISYFTKFRIACEKVAITSLEIFLSLIEVLINGVSDFSFVVKLTILK